MSEYADAKNYFQRLVNFSSASVYKDMLHHAITAFARAEAAEAEVVRLTEELSKSTRWGPPPELPETDTEGRALRARVATMENRVTVAEAEVGRLRAALHSITLSYDERCGIDHATLARSALEAKP